MVTEFEDELFTLELSGLKFDRTDADKNANIARKYKYNLNHFFKHHNPIITKVALEQFIIIKIADGIYFQGYIDLARKDEKEFYIVQDWKSSTIYKGAKIDKEKGQLLLYTEGIRQLGVPLEKIKACWNFLKYCTVTVTQANKKKIKRNIERCDIGKSLHSNAKMWLKKMGHEDNLDYYLEDLLVSNSVDNLPPDVKCMYEFDDCYVYASITQEEIDNFKAEVVDTIAEIELKTKEYGSTKNVHLFWDSIEDVNKNSFYYAVLSGYSANKNLPYKAYLEKLDTEKNTGGGFIVGEKRVVESRKQTDDDMSWLDEL